MVVALSGGADSCALLSILVQLAKDDRFKLIAAHFNHGLRGDESDAEELFCRNLAQKLGVMLVTERMTSTAVPRGDSPEDYYRRQRYRFLDSVAMECGAKKIALGHHLNDQAETVLLNILRGSGADGLKGMLPVRDQRYIRPMIKTSRRDIENYLEKNGIEYCQDSSNQNCDYLRNRVRLELMPLLKEKFNPRIEEGLARMAEIVGRDDDYLSDQVHSIVNSPDIQKNKGMVSFPAVYLNALPEALRFRSVRALLEGMTKDVNGFSFNHIQSIIDLMNHGATGKQISLPAGLLVKKQYDRIIMEFCVIPESPHYEYILPVPGIVDLKERRIMLSAGIGTAQEVDYQCKNKVYLDYDKLQGPLIVRNRRPGDWFEPLGTKGSQKIKKLFIDHKIPRLERERIAFIADRSSVVWIEDLHLSDRVKISPETRRILILEIKRAS